MKRTLLAAAALLSLTGCDRVHFLRPLYSAGDTVQEPALAGVWRDRSPYTLTIRAEDDHYRFESSDGFKATAYLVRLGGTLYADLVEEGAGVPSHKFYRVEVDDRELRLAELKESWALEQVKAHALPFELVEAGKEKDRHFVVTASTGQLQAFLIASPGDAWEEPMAFMRSPEPGQ